MAVSGAYNFGQYRIGPTGIPGTNPQAYQMEIAAPEDDYAVVKITPKDYDPDSSVYYTPMEATLTLSISRKRWYDCFMDFSINRLGDPAHPVGVVYLRGDGAPVPKFVIASRKDAGDEMRLLEIDPDSWDYRVRAPNGSFAQRLTEIANANGIIGRYNSGVYFVTAETANLPVAAAGVLEHWNHPYSDADAVQTYRPFGPNVSYTRYCREGTWSDWN